jgi:hypothetical protein
MAQLLITGTREGREDVWGILEAYVAAYGKPSRMIVGCARGVDSSAFDWARVSGVETLAFAADWVARGLFAGPERNARMVAACRPGDHCLAFPHVDPAKRRGTTDCYTKAQAAGLICWWL